MKNIRVFHLKMFCFLEVKFTMYLNRHVFVMCHSKLIVLRFILSTIQNRRQIFTFTDKINSSGLLSLHVFDEYFLNKQMKA